MTGDSGVHLNSISDADQVQTLLAELHQLAHTPRGMCSAEELEALEYDICRLTNRLGGAILARHLQAALDSPTLQAEEAALVQGWPQALKNDGKETVMIRTSQGTSVAVRVTYYRRKGKRRAGKRYRGLYASLVLLGIHERCTPALTSEVSLLAAMLGSFEEAQKVLAERGTQLNIKTLRQIAYCCARRARLVQQLETHRFEDTVSGRRVVISCDGGRIRLRENKTGRKTNKGRTRYRGAWREPKLFIVYIIDEAGKLIKSFAPFIDATLKGPDAIFKLLRTYLERLDIQQADHVLFVADGAPWIWKRVPLLVHALALKPGQVDELIDFYHAVEHLGKVASLRKIWSAKQRKQWVRRYRRLLLKGQVGQVIEAVRAICRGRNSKAVRQQRDYFVKNTARMAYARLAALHFPIGSGAMESAIRRVVNLRVKGPGIFWYKENAEAILMLRSYYKAGRWNMLKTMANSHLSLLAT